MDSQDDLIGIVLRIASDDLTQTLSTPSANLRASAVSNPRRTQFMHLESAREQLAQQSRRVLRCHNRLREMSRAQE